MSSDQGWVAEDSNIRLEFSIENPPEGVLDKYPFCRAGIVNKTDSIINVELPNSYLIRGEQKDSYYEMGQNSFFAREYANENRGKTTKETAISAASSAIGMIAAQILLHSSMTIFPTFQKSGIKPHKPGKLKAMLTKYITINPKDTIELPPYPVVDFILSKGESGKIIESHFDGKIRVGNKSNASYYIPYLHFDKKNPMLDTMPLEGESLQFSKEDSPIKLGVSIKYNIGKSMNTDGELSISSFLSKMIGVKSGKEKDLNEILADSTYSDKCHFCIDSK